MTAGRVKARRVRPKFGDPSDNVVTLGAENAPLRRGVAWKASRNRSGLEVTQIMPEGVYAGANPRPEKN